MKSECIEVLLGMAENARPAYPEGSDGEVFRSPKSYAMALVVAIIAMDGSKNPWHFPYALCRRLGLEELTADGLADVDIKDMIRACEGLHRSPRTMGRWLHGAAIAIRAHFGGRAAWIWNDGKEISAERLLMRLCHLPGVGTTKALMLMGVLGRDWGVPITGWEKIDPEMGGAMRRAATRVGWSNDPSIDPRAKSSVFEGFRVLATLYCLERPACDRCPMESCCPRQGLGEGHEQ